ncbi:helix-turn-helix domain-containing protein [Chelativorans sp. M5D2P16]|nr:helix-turn-helix domain-containing protein [Chelativorans sp. M5D2P16]MDZ5697470.1 helix-turn-helix domain-containing protein [Chelativorans sp. M5D2P16]
MRVASHEGLHAVSFRAVATEAGVSLRLVQYYFGTKAGLT